MFDRIIRLLVSGAVVIALAASCALRASAATECPKPPIHKRHMHHKVRPAPLASCVIPPTPLPLAPIPEPIAAPIVLTRYQDAPETPIAPHAPAPLYPPSWYEPISGVFDSGFVIDWGIPAFFKTVYYITNTAISNSYSTVNNSSASSTVINDSETVYNTVVNPPPITPPPRICHPKAARAPELDASGAGGMLTFLFGSLCVLRGRKLSSGKRGES